MPLIKNALGASPARLPATEPARIAALRGYEILDTPREAAFDDIVFLASHICGTPISLISLVDTERQWFKAAHGVDVREGPRDAAFCAHAILDPHRALEIPDTLSDERFNTNPSVVDDPRIRFYYGVPLVSPDGHALGTLCTLDQTPRTLDENQRRALRALANEVSMQLELRRTLAMLGREITSMKNAINPPPGVPVASIEDRMRSLTQHMLELHRRFEASTRR